MNKMPSPLTPGRPTICVFCGSSFGNDPAYSQAAKAIGDWRLNEATLYVTKEPCPMCSGATLMSRVKRVVYAVGDPKMGCLGGATDLNALPQVNHHLEITRGILDKPCLELLQAYFKMKRAEE